MPHVNIAPNPTMAEIPPELTRLVQAGTAALDDGDLRGALEKFETVVSAFPDRPEGHNNLGALYSSMGDYEKAEQCFTTVINLLPDNPNIIYNRGVVRSHMRKLDAAKTDFSTVLNLVPNDPDALNNLGVATYLEGDFAAARIHFTNATAARPGFTNAILNHIDLECSASNTTQAIAVCESYLATHASIEVRRKHLELLITISRDALGRSAQAAESILVVTPDDEAVQTELTRITKATALWANTTGTNANEAAM